MPDQTAPDEVVVAARRTAPRAARCEPLAFQQAIEAAYATGRVDGARAEHEQTTRLRAEIAADIDALIARRGQIDHRAGSVYAERQRGERVGLSVARDIVAGEFNIRSPRTTEGDQQ